MRRILMRSLSEVLVGCRVLRTRLSCPRGDLISLAFKSAVLVLSAGLGLFCAMGCGDDDGASPANHAPVITGLSANPDTVQAGEDSQITCTAGDADGDDLTYVWEAPFGTLTGSTATVVWTAPVSAGGYSISVTVEDAHGAAAVDSVAVVVAEEDIDQSNLPEWDGGWTHINPAPGRQAVMWQTFMPGHPNLTAVEIDILTSHPGAGDDTVTVEIADGGNVLASAERLVENGSEGLLRFDFPEIVHLVPEQTYELRVHDTGRTIFGWKYGGETYERGVRYVATEERIGTDWLFRTFSEVYGMTAQ
jgi:hypothetical protein